MAGRARETTDDMPEHTSGDAGAGGDDEKPRQRHADAVSKRCAMANAARSQSRPAHNVRLPDSCPNTGRTPDKNALDQPQNRPGP
jgi:hypothetical protein